MKNIEVSVQAGKLIIEVDMDVEHGPSASGKTTIIGTTSGAAKVAQNEAGQDVILNCTVYRKP